MLQTTVSHNDANITFDSHREPNRYRVLLADDTQTIRTVLTKILQRGGHEVTAVSNGLEAFQSIERKLINTHQRYYDVVILDLHMPILDGFETMKRIRILEQHYNIKHMIIGCSANDDKETITEMISSGADTFLTKPFSLLQFEQSIVNNIEK